MLRGRRVTRELQTARYTLLFWPQIHVYSLSIEVVRQHFQNGNSFLKYDFWLPLENNGNVGSPWELREPFLALAVAGGSWRPRPSPVPRGWTRVSFSQVVRG